MVLDQTWHYQFYRDVNRTLHVKLSRNEEIIDMAYQILGFDSEIEYARAEFKILKFELSLGHYGVGNVIIEPEFQEIFNEVMNDPTIND